MPLFQKRRQFSVKLIQGRYIRGKLLRYIGIPAFIRRRLKRTELVTCARCQAPERVRPRGHYLVGFLLAVAPYLEQATQPVLSRLLLAAEVAVAHAEKRQTLAAIERLCSGALPFVRSRLHGFERFTRLLCAGYVIDQRYGGRDCARGDCQPDRWRTAQHGQQAAHTTAGLANGCGELAYASAQCAYPLCDLAHHKQYRPRRRGIRCHAYYLHTLCRVHLHKAIQQLARAIYELLYSRVEVVAKLLCEQQRGVFEIGEPALSGGIALAGFFC